MWYVYILRCRDASLYTGVTDDLQKRLHAHNHLPTAAKYTRSRRPVSLIYHEELATKSEALKREIAIKKLTKQEKEKLVCHADVVL